MTRIKDWQQSKYELKYFAYWCSFVEKANIDSQIRYFYYKFKTIFCNILHVDNPEKIFCLIEQITNRSGYR